MLEGQFTGTYETGALWLSLGQDIHAEAIAADPGTGKTPGLMSQM